MYYRFMTSKLVCERMQELLEWRHGRTYIPKGSKRLLYLIDDLNMCYVRRSTADLVAPFLADVFLISSGFQVDKYGYQTATELIRQHLDEGGFYSPYNFQWRYVRNVTYVSTMNPKPQSNVPKLSARLLRHFAILYCPMPGYAVFV